MNVRTPVVALVVLVLALAAGPLSAGASSLSSTVMDTPASGPELPGLPEVLWLVNCDFTYSQCLSGCPAYGDPQACELGCMCSYYACKGFEIPNECI
jgi:hypothetical protein